MEGLQNALYDAIKDVELNEVTGAMVEFLKEHEDYPVRDFIEGFGMYARDRPEEFDDRGREFLNMITYMRTPRKSEDVNPCDETNGFSQ